MCHNIVLLAAESFRKFKEALVCAGLLKVVGRDILSFQQEQKDILSI